jgi:hypothetical protein
METKRSSPSSKQPIACSYCEICQISLLHPNRVLLTSTLILSSYIGFGLGNGLSPSGFRLKTLNVFPLLRYMLHVLPILFSSICSPGKILMGRPNYEAITIINLL